MAYGLVKDEQIGEVLEESDVCCDLWNDSGWLWLCNTKPSEVKEMHDWTQSDDSEWGVGSEYENKVQQFA